MACARSLSVGQQPVVLNVGPASREGGLQSRRSGAVRRRARTWSVERCRAEGLEAGAVQALRALAATEHQHHRQRPPSSRTRPCPAAASAASWAADSGRPVTTKRGGSRPSIGKLRQTRRDERREQAVGDAQVSVALDRQRGHAAQRRRRPPRARSGSRRRPPRPAGRTSETIAQERGAAAARRHSVTALPAGQQAALEAAHLERVGADSARRRARPATGVVTKVTTRAARGELVSDRESRGDVPPRAARRHEDAECRSGAGNDVAPAVACDVGHDADAGQHHHQARAAERHERQRHAGERQHAESGADVDRRPARRCALPMPAASSLPYGSRLFRAMWKIVHTRTT